MFVFYFVYFFNKEYLIENQQKRRLTKNILQSYLQKYTIHHELQNTDAIHNKKVIMKCGQ